MPNKSYGIFLCLISVLIWGTMFPIMRIVLKVMDPFTFTLIRYAIASLILIPALFLTEGKSFWQAQEVRFKIDGKILLVWLYGSIGFAGFGFFMFFGQKIIGGSTGAINASTVESTMPVMSILLLWLINGRKPNIRTFLMIILSLIGIIFLIGINNIISLNTNIYGDICLLLGTLSWIIYTTGFKKFPDWSPLKYTALSCFLGVLTMAAIVPLFDIIGISKIPSVNILYSVWPEILFMAIIAGALAVFTWNIGNNIIGPLNGIFFINLIPITTLIITLISGGHVKITDYIGMFIVLTAITVNNIINLSAK